MCSNYSISVDYLKLYINLTPIWPFGCLDFSAFLLFPSRDLRFIQAYEHAQLWFKLSVHDFPAL